MLTTQQVTAQARDTSYPCSRLTNLVETGECTHEQAQQSMREMGYSHQDYVFGRSLEAADARRHGRQCLIAGL